MIVVDTSAVMALAQGEPESEACLAALALEGEVLISAGTLAELLIVSVRRSIETEVSQLIDRFGIEIVPVTATSSRLMAQAYALWGRGVHAAALNFGDCFAYQLAKERDCPLLFVGDDFAKTDIKRVLV